MHQVQTATRTISLVYFNAGGGHRSAALALQAAIGELGLPWQVQLVNLLEVLDPQDLFRHVTRMKPEDYYNRRLARGWTIGLAQELKILQRLIRLGHSHMVRKLKHHWLSTRPDMVVSLIPNFNRALYASVSAALPRVPYVTILTDLADFPPHFWMEPGQPQHLVCGTARAVEQARACGYPPARVHATSGMIIHPDFYRPVQQDRAEELLRLGLDPALRTGVVMFGGHGSRAMLGIARELKDTQLILICGHSRRVEQQLRAMPAAAPRLVLGFTREMQRYMQLGDFFIGKPGPGSLSEALHQGLPVIVVRNHWTMPQERYNTEWVREQGVGIVLSSFRQVRRGVESLLENLDGFRARVRRLENHAVYEVPGILGAILASDQARAVGPWVPARPDRLAQVAAAAPPAGP